MNPRALAPATAPGTTDTARYVTGCQPMRVRDGLILEVRGNYCDQSALDAFWQAG
jgi:hypothetical protein